MAELNSTTMVGGETIFEGYELPEYRHRVTRMSIAWMAVALEDPNEIHVEDTVASEAGFDTVIAHGTFPVGMIGTMITNWIGPGRVKYLSIRLEAPTFPGNEIVAGARISEIANQELRLEIWAQSGGKRVASGECALIWEQ